LKERGVPKNPEERVVFLTRSAGQSNRFGQFDLGKARESGIGWAKDFMIAARNYLFAAAQGNPGAQYHFRMCLMNGQAIGENIEEAVAQFPK
jgi:TPR repeat protein